MDKDSGQSVAGLKESDERQLSALSSHQEQARSTKAFDHLLGQYRKLSDSERLKGNFFEQLVRQYLPSSDVYN